MPETEVQQKKDDDEVQKKSQLFPQAPVYKLSQNDILAAVAALPKEKERNGNGRAAEMLAAKLGMSLTAIYRVQTVIKNASPADIAAIKNDDLTINKVYTALKARKNTPVI
jgi:hypothetical protein